ncbi:MAG: acyl-CoA dehydrogenase family protein [Halioglobus sp.]|nr:acyl-CoA dehydrogenase family protein [Halioglobus sp.]
MIRGDTTLTFSDEQAMLMDVAREFCRDKSPMTVVREHLEQGPGFDPGVWQEIVGLGWTGIALPESCGGSGLGVGALVPVVEAMGRAMLSTPLISTALAGQVLLRAGGARMESVLAQIAGGAAATVAWLENGDWGDDTLATTLDADGVLQGSKAFVTDAEVAELIVVPARRDGNTVLAVVRGEQLSGGAIRPNVLIDQTRRSAHVDLSGVVVDPAHVVEGAAVEAALRDGHLIGALLLAAEAAGSSAACLDTVVDYLNTRKQFGKLIGSYQALKHPTVDILLDVDSTRSFVYHAASVVGDEALDADAEIACRMAKAQASKTLSFAGDRAVQFHGGMGFTYECDAQLYIRRAQWSQQQFGDPQHHRKRLASLLLD